MSGTASTRRQVLQGVVCGLLDLAVDAHAQSGIAGSAPLEGRPPNGVKVFDFTKDFNGNGDGSFDNSGTLKKFNIAAKEESRTGAVVKLNVEPGSYLFDHSKCQGFLEGIARLEIEGPGAIFTNIFDPLSNDRNFNFELPWGRGSRPLMGYDGSLASKDIVKITKGENYFECKGELDEFFKLGNWYIITSLDIQYYGYPPNADRFEFVQIANLDRRRGIVFLGSKIVRDHSTTFPDGGSALPCGKARVWALDREGASWNIEHIYNGLQINKCPHSKLVYTTITGKSFRFVNCILPGVSQSVARDVSIIGGEIKLSSEPDKLVEFCSYDGVDMLDVSFQSSSINNVIIKDCKIRDKLNSGGVKNIEIINCVINRYDCHATCGVSRRVMISGCNIADYKYFRRFIIDTPQDEIRNGIFYKDGSLNLPKDPSVITRWNIVPGMMLYLCGPDDRFVGDVAAGVVTSIEEDDKYFRIITDLPFAELPPWASGRIRIVRGVKHTISRSVGCDPVLSASYATDIGRSEWATFRRTLTSSNYKNAELYGNVGSLISARFEVLRETSLKEACFMFTEHNAREGGPFGSAGDISFKLPLDRRGQITFKTGSSAHGLAGGVISFRNAVVPSVSNLWLDGARASCLCLRGQEVIEFPFDAEIVVTLELDLGRFREGTGRLDD